MLTGDRHPGLDGLRALALVAAVLYHVDPDVVPGGFLGVDLFFVLSGYLITSLLLREHHAGGRISLRSFWGRRIRRLWPLAWIILAGVAMASVAGVWGSDRQRSLPWEIVASVANVANWYQIDHGGYVQSFAAPSPLRHYWSLAIEEQFYALWPPLLAGLLALRRRWAVPATLGGLAVGSAVMGVVFRAQPDRVYLGTDVRLVALVVGVSLGWAWRAHPLRGPDGPTARRLSTGVGVVGLATLGWGVMTVHGDDPRLAVGGFAAAALAAGAVVALTLTSRVVQRVLSWRPLQVTGRISYAWYLVHWPLLVAIGPGRSWWLRAVVALPISGVAAALLHRWVERPVIERRVRRVALASVAVVLVAGSGFALVEAAPQGATPTEQVARSLGKVPDPTSAATVTTVPTAVPTTACVPPTTPPRDFGDSDGFDPATVEEIADPTVSCAAATRVLVLGDSTGRGAANGLVALGDPRLEVWDRTVLGCSYGDERCPDWRTVWPAAVETIDPDVVLVSTGVVSDLHGVDDPPFMSTEATKVREQQLRHAVEVLAARGAGVALVAGAEPRRPKGLFFCDGDATDSNCDPRWVARWNDSLRVVSAGTGAKVVDTAGWIAARGSTAADRPDGAHLAGKALVAYAEWLTPQLLAAARAGP